MDEEILGRARAAAAKVFKRMPAMSFVGSNLYAFSNARLFIWKDVAGTFHLMNPGLNAAGGLDLIEIDLPVTNAQSVAHAITLANTQTDGVTQFPHQQHGWGFVAEDLWLRICEHLGYSTATSALHRVRHATVTEDKEEKADIILQDGSLSIPIQISTGAGSTSKPGKRRAVRAGKVAHIAMRRFVSQDVLEDFLSDAAEGKPLAVWYAGEILKGAIGAYLGTGYKLPKAVAYSRDFSKEPFFQHQIKNRLQPPWKETIDKALQAGMHSDQSCLESKSFDTPQVSTEG